MSAGALFSYPGLLIAALAGVGAANFLKDPSPWLNGLLAGARTALVSSMQRPSFLL